MFIRALFLVSSFYHCSRAFIQGVLHRLSKEDAVADNLMITADVLERTVLEC